MKVQLSTRVLKVKPSATLAVTARAAELRAEGKPVIGLGAGEPDFDTPQYIKEAAIEAINAGKTKYTAVDGTPALKKAIVDKFKRENQLDYAPNQVIVSCGGKQSFFNLCQAVLNPGDEVIIPAPFWVSYPDIVMLAGGIPSIVYAGIDQDFKITTEQLEQAISPMTKMLVINSPSNPTGMAYLAEELKAFGEVLRRHPQVLVVTDDMYEHIYWGGEPFQNIVNVCPDLYDRVMVLNGVSKAFSMTGWRIGYAAGSAEIVKAMKTIQSQSTSNPASISQAAAEAALSGGGQAYKEMNDVFKQRHDFIVNALNEIPGLRCLPSMGTFYAFPDFSEKVKDFKDDVEFAEHLLNEAMVALVPGSAFGAAGHMRLSYATSMDNLQEAVKRLKGLYK